MPIQLYRAVLALCGVFALGAVLNVAFLQREKSQLATFTKGTPVTTETTKPHVPFPDLTVRAPAALPSVELIRAIQRELRNAGYSKRNPDGILDMPTRAAILAYESDIGLKITAEPSENLLKAMLLGATVEGHSAAGTPPAETAAHVIRHVQRLLARNGSEDLRTTGRNDEPTRRAIMAFEKGQGLPAKGRITAELVERLQRQGQRS
ncbi:MAG TPA: peptidoglycan-binding domain-containing protein [Hyphomicrobiaceae bacterium]|nr:peptidoglycan-binding domain-containing protein [Hyphomicrobiaceae bacterium]